MFSDPLANLLRAADRASQSAPATVADILRCVERRRRRRSVRRATMVVSAALLTAIGVWTWHDDAGPTEQRPLAANPPRGAGPPRLAPPAVDPNWRAELARLEHEAQQARALAQALQLARAVADAQATMAALPPAPRSPRELAAEHLDTAARTSVLRADMLRESYARLDEAAAAYRAVIERFPETRWATVARGRLMQMGRMN